MRVPRRTAALTALAMLAVLPALSRAAESSGVTCISWDSGAATSVPCVGSGSQYTVGATTFEPTIGAAPDGSLYFSTTPGSGVAVGFGAGISRSTDGGQTWTDVGAKIAGRSVPVETNDPYIYVDHTTGRAFEFHMSPILTCATVSYSDDGGASWFTNPVGCGPTGAWDHQTMVAAKPRVLKTVGYPNVVHQCVNAVYAEMCSRSLDGGRTWLPSTPAYQNNATTRGTTAGTQTGHLVAMPNGTVLLPTTEGGYRPYVYRSLDDGLTWTRSTIADTPVPFTDPTLAVDKDGVVYAAYVDANGAMFYATSKDGAATWSPSVRVTPPGITATLPAITVGDAGQVAIAFPGTNDLKNGFADYSKPAAQTPGITWGGWFASTTEGLAAKPVFRLVEATGSDPLERARACVSGGRCTAQVDFIELTVTPDGIPVAAFADGCVGACVLTGTANSSGTGQAVAVIPGGVDLCAARCDRFGPATAGAAQPVPMTGPTMTGVPAPSAQQGLPAGLDEETLRAVRLQLAGSRPFGYGLAG